MLMRRSPRVKPRFSIISMENTQGNVEVEEAPFYTLVQGYVAPLLLNLDLTMVARQKHR